MQIRGKCLLLSLFLVLGISCQSALAENEGSDWAIDAKIGTLGIGADVSRALVRGVLNLRIGASFFSYSDEFNAQEIDYSGELRLGAVPIALDVFPLKNWFRLGGGFIVNLNQVTGTAVPRQGVFDIGDNTYNAQEIGQLKAKAQFNRIAPYFGLGFNNPVKKKGHWGFFVDLGAIYHGQPSFNLTATNTNPQLQADLNKEIQKVENEIKDYKFFPVIQLGVSYHF